MFKTFGNYNFKNCFGFRNSDFEIPMLRIGLMSGLSSLTPHSGARVIVQFALINIKLKNINELLTNVNNTLLTSHCQSTKYPSFKAFLR